MLRCSFLSVVAISAIGFVSMPLAAQVGVEGPRTLVPKFEEILWQDAFGIDYEHGENVLLLGQVAADGTRPLVALDAVGDPVEWVTHETIYEELFSMPFEFEAPESETLVIQATDDIMILDIEITRNISAGSFTGSTGVELIVTGMVYDIVIEQIPAPPTGPIEFSFFFPSERHLDEAAAIAFAAHDPDVFDWPEPAVEEEVDCYAEKRLCYRLESSNYRIALATNCDGLNWTAVIGGGTAGAGAGFIGGGAIGTVLPGVGNVAGAAFGSIYLAVVGAIVAEAIADRNCRAAQKNIYWAKLDACDARYDYCVETGEWPSQ